MRATLLALLALTACRLSAQSAAAPREPEHAALTGVFHNPKLRESSGVTLSSRTPGLLWTLNDSGNDPLLFATDTLGTDLGTVRVSNARNVDWEDLSTGPCAAGATTRCLYIADTGDNDERRDAVTIYRLAEPAAPGRGAPEASARADALHFRYPDGPHDAEALYVDARGDTYIVTKGRSGGIRLFRLRADAWTSTTPVVATSLGAIAIAPDTALRRWVTGAALSPDGTRVAVRTYGEIFFFRRAADGTLPPETPAACRIAGLEPQGEAIAWLDPRRLVLTSERVIGLGGSITLVTCPLDPPPSR